MKNNQNSIDNLVSNILNEEIEKKVQRVMEDFKDGRKKIDVAEPKGKITGADFKKLRAMKGKKSETNEGEEVCSECGSKMYEGECSECGYGRMEEDMDEYEFEEGNAFSGARADAIERGDDEFEVDGKTYPVREGKEKWIQKTKMQKGALHKKLRVPEGETIPVSKLKSLKKELQGKAKGDKKLSASDSKLLKQVNLALTLKGIKESKETFSLTESEMVDMIESIIVEQKKKKEEEVKVKKVVNKLKDNINKKYVSGLAKTEKALSSSKKENDKAISDITKKMKEYLKNGSEEMYEANPTKFPKGNGQDKKGDIMAFHNSDAVDEYIDAFAYPGMTNLVYDEIKPEDEKIEKYLKGSSETGNAEVDESGNPLGNVVPSEVGERFMNNYKNNFYGQEQMKSSYKRYPQDTREVAGDQTKKGGLNYGKGKGKTAQSIINKVEESVDEKKIKLISEEMDKMKNLISYKKNTQ